MSTDTGSPLFEEMHGWLIQLQVEAEGITKRDEPQITNRIERDVLAERAHRAARYLTALADRLELFDA